MNTRKSVQIDNYKSNWENIVEKLKIAMELNKNKSINITNNFTEK